MIFITVVHVISMSICLSVMPSDAFWNALFSNASGIITSISGALIALFLYRHNTRLGKINTKVNTVDTKVDKVDEKVNGLTEKRLNEKDEVAKAKEEAAEAKGELKAIKDVKLEEALKKLPPEPPTP